MEIKVKYLRDIEHIKEIKQGDWIDLRCAEGTMLRKGEYKAIPLGVAIQLPEGYSAIIAPRSSLFKNFGLLCANSIGIVDNSYNGDGDEWHFLVYATKQVMIFKNERICQFRIVPNMPKINLRTVEKLGNENRGGIGSTGGV